MDLDCIIIPLIITTDGNMKIIIISITASPEYNVGLPTSELLTDIVLLSEPHNVRVVREALSSNDSSDESETSDLSGTTVPVSSVHGYGTSEEEQGSARDRTSNDPLLKELDNNVDIVVLYRIASIELSLHKWIGYFVLSPKIFKLIFTNSLYEVHMLSNNLDLRQDIYSGFTPWISRKHLKYIHLVTRQVLCPEAED